MGVLADFNLVAAHDIEPETTLFTIPRKGIMSIETSRLPSEIPEVFDLDSGEDDNAPKQDSWSLLILVMIYEYLRDSDSLWKPYFDVLPATFNTPMFWTEEELNEVQASPMRQKVGRHEAEEMFRASILPVIRSKPNLFAGSQAKNDHEIIDLAHRMGSIIMSYAFDLENDLGEEAEEENDDGWEVDKEGKSMMGMVPMADILNADAEFNAHVNHGDDSLTVTALRHIKAGEEILNYYGPHANSELLRRYGYTTQKHARYDVVEIPWDVVNTVLEKQLLSSGVSSAAIAQVRKSIEEDDEFDDVFVLERESGEPNPDGTFAGPAAVTSMPEDLEERLKEVLKRISKLHPEAVPDKRKRKTLSSDVLTQTLLNLESRYSTNIAEDQRILESCPPERQRMATIVRLGEKQLLQEAKAFLQSDGSNGADEASSAPNKRTKVSA